MTNHGSQDSEFRIQEPNNPLMNRLVPCTNVRERRFDKIDHYEIR
jgi:hypothetical protein